MLGTLGRIGAAVMALGVLAACNHDVGGPPVYGGPQPSNREMRAFCEDEAARRYDVGRRAVEVGSVQAIRNGYVTEGRVFLSGQRDRIFECRFGPRGGFDGMREVGVAGGGGYGGGTGGQAAASNREMREFCEAETARRYNVSRRSVEIGRVQSTGRGFRTEGRVFRQGRRDAVVECRFGPRGGFDGMVELSGEASGGLSRPEMRAFCEDEAARRYNVGKRAIEIGRVRDRSKGFKTEGRIVRGDLTGTVFECKFGPRGGFDGMRETQAAPVQAATRPEMRRACREEASRRYNRPIRQIEVAQVQVTGNNFTAKGTTVDRGRTVIFECAFSARGDLGAFRQLSP